MSKSKKITSRKKVVLELLHHRLGHISTRSLMAGDNVKFWNDIELSIDTDPLCKLYQIILMNKKDR